MKLEEEKHHLKFHLKESYILYCQVWTLSHSYTVFGCPVLSFNVRKSISILLFRRSLSALLFQWSLSTISSHPQFSVNWSHFIWNQHIQNHSSVKLSLLHSPLHVLYSFCYKFWAYDFVSIPNLDECMFELGSYVNIGEKPTSWLTPRSIEITFRTVVRHDRASYYYSTFWRIFSYNLKAVYSQCRSRPPTKLYQICPSLSHLMERTTIMVPKTVDLFLATRGRLRPYRWSAI